jgi:hypothetical protein
MKDLNLYSRFKVTSMLVLIVAFLVSLFGASPSLASDTPDNQNVEANNKLTVFLPLIRTKNLDRISGFLALSTEIGRYDKFEIHFSVKTDAANPSLPYDPNPPSGLQAGLGVSVDVLFSHDNWNTTLVQPAFLYQPYHHQVMDSKDHFVPNGPPRWVARFTPQKPGAWQYRIRVVDAAGTDYFPSSHGSLPFNVKETTSSPYARAGFLRVSSRDPRYFEFQDGTPFIGVGFNDGFSSYAKVEEKMKAFELNKLNLIRTWISGSGINGSQWTSWASHHLPGDGYIPGVKFDTKNTYQGADVALLLDNSNPCFYGDFWQGGIPVLPDTTYNVWARVKVDGVSGPASSGDHGFVIKQGGWLDKECSKASKGTIITSPVKGSTDWITVSGSYKTGSSQNWLDNFYLTLQNATGGRVYIDEVRVWKADDPAQINILREPKANSHMEFDPMNSALWDKYIELAQRHGVYLKLVIDEKNEWIRNRIGPDGKVGDSGKNDNFYAGTNTKVRWLQQAWWRYIIARWGYSTAIHSFEYVNEGDPYNGRHHDAANAMGRYFRENDPSRHMVSTSFWAAFPNKEFWSNPKYEYMDYASIHAYISTGWGLHANLLESHRKESNLAHVRSGNGSARISGTDNKSQAISPRGLVIKGAGEWIVRYWMKAEGFSANCQNGSSGSMVRVRWMIDGGPYSGGKEGIVPAQKEGKDLMCTSPSGTFDWQQFTSDKDRDGATVQNQYRLILTDDNPHEISIRIENNIGSGGVAWIDDIELVSPSGEVINVLGYFDLTPMDDDTAWYNYAYGDVFGGGSPTGAGMPLIRGETGVDYPDRQDWNRDLLKDTEGIWLHNNVWGQINHGGMYDLFWWSSETIPPKNYTHFLTFRNFMEGIPLSNGHYYQARSQTSHGDLRAWGQRDDANGRMHLWIQNTSHTWKRVISGQSISPVHGSVSILNVPAGAYEVEWWDPYKVSNPVIKKETISANGTLNLTLPYGLTKDVAVKIKRLP